jgi:hypothetical protein
MKKKMRRIPKECARKTDNYERAMHKAFARKSFLKTDRKHTFHHEVQQS